MTTTKSLLGMYPLYKASFANGYYWYEAIKHPKGGWEILEILGDGSCNSCTIEPTKAAAKKALEILNNNCQIPEDHDII